MFATKSFQTGTQELAFESMLVIAWIFIRINLEDRPPPKDCKNYRKRKDNYKYAIDDETGESLMTKESEKKLEFL